jgi:hypothetical protein
MTACLTRAWLPVVAEAGADHKHRREKHHLVQSVFLTQAECYIRRNQEAEQADTGSSERGQACTASLA